jgi:hypothetical protein
MTNISELLRGICPIAIRFYFDRIRIWLREPLSQPDRKLIERHCGRLHVRSVGFGCYRQKIEVYQPREIALRALERLSRDAIVEYLEVSCDLIMADPAQIERLLEAFKHGFLQPWHRSKGVQSYPSGFSTRRFPKRGQRRGGFWFQWYGDKPCKLTGELNCFHFEGKYEGRQFVKRLGIQHPRDLKDFDFDSYFRKYLKLYRLDRERLARYDHNKRTHAKRKRTNINDRKLGMALYRILSAHADQEDRSLQRFVDQYGRGPYLIRVNIYDHWHKLVTSHLIPSAERYSRNNVSKKSIISEVVD